jgi:hypothetical protein
MKQTTLSVVLEAQPQSVRLLADLIDNLRMKEESADSGYDRQYGRLMERVPALHFISISIFPCGEYDPVFVIEANFDGAPGPFWAQVEAALGDDIRPMLRCCKRPADFRWAALRRRHGAGVAAPHRTLPRSPHRAAERLPPRQPGPRPERILDEETLFKATRTELARDGSAEPNPYRSMTAPEIHASLRAALLPRLSLARPAGTTPHPGSERAADIARLVGFVFAVLAGLSLPGIVGSLLAPTGRFLVISALLAALFAFLLYRMRNPLEGKAAPARVGGLTPQSLSTKNDPSSLANPVTFWGAVAAFLAAYVAVATLLGAAVMVPVSGLAFDALLAPTFRSVLLGLLSAVAVTVPALVVWLRWLERRDSTHDAPPIDPALLRAMARREDRIAQNHMGSVVLIKPGILRMILIRVGHLGLGLLVRVVATDGYLGSMRTIHFAHWAFVNNGSR